MAKILTLVVTACLFVVIDCQAPQEHRAAPANLKQMNVNGVSLKYLEQGQGTAVVFVHGSNSDHRIWEPQREVIAQRYRFIALSQRYFGTDLWPDNGTKFSVATHADDLAAFIRELKAGPVNLVGWSYSGPIVFAVAIQCPELVRSLFLFEPSVGSIVSDPADAKTIAEDRTEMAGPARAATKGRDNVAAVRTFMDSVNAQPGTFNAFPPAVRTIMLDNARMLPLLFAAPPPSAITCAQLRQIKVPVAIARGELTRPFYRIIADTANRCIPTSQLIIVPKARHLWPVQEPAAFNQTLLSFLKSN